VSSRSGLSPVEALYILSGKVGALPVEDAA
jgi:hypothetical protein